jgi:8-oxo-dGTP diphosphatase
MQPATRLPIVGVSTLVSDGERVLLVKRGRGTYAGLWAFPGGKVEFGESLAEAAAREVSEETGIAVEIGERIDVIEIIDRDEGGNPVAHFLLTVFAGTATGGGDPKAADDALDARWVTRAELAAFGLTPQAARILAERGWM